MVVDSASQSELSSCALCTTPARYMCPRCATPTCSLPCSRKHKQDTGCTGERDKARYVSMNAYGWGTMMRDYCYLEELGRKVGDWGSEIVRGGYMDGIVSGKAASTRKKTWSGRRQATRKSKRDILRDHLERLGIDVEFLPAGMERRNLNQSTFDRKLNCPLLTIELIFYPPTTLTSISSLPPPPQKILSHRNSPSMTLLTVLQRQVAATLSKQKENALDWLPSMVTPHPEAPECFVPPHCYIRASTEIRQAPMTAYYHRLEPTLSLSELLQATSFVEFPTVHVFEPEASSFCGTIIDKYGSIVRVSGENQVNVARATKRRKLNEVAGLKAVFSLVGGYESEGSSHSVEEMDNHPTGLATLEVYSGSDDEVTSQGSGVDEAQSLNSHDACNEDNLLDLDPAKLLEFMKQARNAADEDILDWGDGWDVDAEEQMSTNVRP